MNGRRGYGQLAAIALLLTVCLPISWSAYRFATRGREHGIMKLKVLLELPPTLGVLDRIYIRVYNLSAPARLLETVVEVGSVPPEGLEFNFFVWREGAGFLLQHFLVTASTLDGGGKLWTASSIVSVNPYKPYGEVTLRFRRLASRQVSADHVPAPGQTRDFYDTMVGPAICAFSIPDGVRYYVNIPIGMSFTMVAKEKAYWTEDPTTGVWWEEDWVSVHEVVLKISGGVEGRTNGPISIYYYPQNIDVRMYTVAETTPVYMIRLFVVPMDFDGDIYVSGSAWSPCSSGTAVRVIVYGDTVEYSWITETVWRVRLITVSANFTVMTGKTTTINFSGGIQAQVEPQYFEQRIQVYDWSRAPAGTTKLVIYACDPGNHLVRAQYEG